MDQEQRDKLQHIGENAHADIEEGIAAIHAAQEQADDEDGALHDAEQALYESPLSVDVRSGWYTPWGDQPGPEEYRVLLACGGPAVRIVGDLNSHGEPVSARLEVQDWFLPWTETHRDTDALMEYVQRIVSV